MGLNVKNFANLKFRKIINYGDTKPRPYRDLRCSFEGVMYIAYQDKNQNQYQKAAGAAKKISYR